MAEFILFLMLRCRYAIRADDPVRAPRPSVEEVVTTGGGQRSRQRFRPPVKFYDR